MRRSVGAIRSENWKEVNIDASIFHRTQNIGSTALCPMGS